MQLVRTTLRIQTELKKKAEKIALEENTTLQEIFNRALLEFLVSQKTTRSKKIKIKTVDLGVALDNLTRDDYYDDPNFS